MWPSPAAAAVPAGIGTATARETAATVLARSGNSGASLRSALETETLDGDLRMAGQPISLPLSGPFERTAGRLNFDLAVMLGSEGKTPDWCRSIGGDRVADRSLHRPERPPDSPHRLLVDLQGAGGREGRGEGLTGGSIDFSATLADLGSPQQIIAPSSRQPASALVGALGALVKHLDLGNSLASLRATVQYRTLDIVVAGSDPASEREEHRCLRRRPRRVR